MEEKEEIIVRDILKMTEALLVVAGGRPLLQALSFGGITKLSRRIFHFLEQGSIHRGKHGEVSCIPYLVLRSGAHNKHLLRNHYSDYNDVIEMITERIVESNLHKALNELTCDSRQIENNYDQPSCMRNKDCITSLLECARFLDEQDLDSLNIFQLDFKAQSRPGSSNSREGSMNDEQDNIENGHAVQVSEDSEDSKSSTTSLPDLTEIGMARFLSKKTSVKDKQPSGYKRGHKRVVSDTTVIIEKDLYEVQPLPKVPEQDNPEPANPKTSWKYPRPDTPDQSWYDYIFSGHFSQYQTQLDMDNAHLILAETAIYHKNCKVKKSPNQLMLPEQLKERSAEHLLLQLLDSTEEPTSLPAWEALRLLKDRGDPHAANLFNDTEQNFSRSIGWSPPNRELIFSLPPRPKRGANHQMALQNWLCNSCGQGVNRKFVQTMRFCHFFGKYCCAACHSNRKHVLPSLILHRWDFTEKIVSDFAFDTLTQLSDKPLISINTINPLLTKKVTRLNQAVELRTVSLKCLKYLETCRMFKEDQSESLTMLKFQDPLVFSLTELCSIRLGIYNNRLASELDNAIKHILSCELCRAKAFFCERCRSQDLIFPFQDHIVQCQKCFACYHEKCWAVKQICSKCLRVRIRDKSLTEV